MPEVAATTGTPHEREPITMNPNLWYSAATDTQEIRSDLRGPYWETQTVEIPVLDLRPAVEPIDKLAADLGWFIKRAAGLIVLIVALLALSAGPADARPGGVEKDTYKGPCAVCQFAGVKAAGSVDR